MITTASYILDSESYVKHGAFNDQSQAWGDTFRALGGEKCSITPSWTHGLPVGDIFMEVVGSPKAVAFVDNTIAV
jgi:hypothetical protein